MRLELKICQKEPTVLGAVQVVLTFGIVIAQAINLGTQHVAGYGWRISLAFAGMPAIVLTLGGLLLPDTPNSLIERGHEDLGKQVCALSFPMPSNAGSICSCMNPCQYP